MNHPTSSSCYMFTTHPVMPELVCIQYACEWTQWTIQSTWVNEPSDRSSVPTEPSQHTIWSPCSCGPTECVGDTAVRTHGALCRSWSPQIPFQDGNWVTVIYFWMIIWTQYVYRLYSEMVLWFGVWTVRNWSELDRGLHRTHSVHTASPLVGCCPSTLRQVNYESRDHSAKWKHSAGASLVVING